MELSVVIARIIAVGYLAAGVGVFSGTIKFQRLITDFEKSAGLTYVTGFFTLILGCLMVNYHNLWVSNWRVLITLIGWMALIKGICLIAYPEFISRFKSWYQHEKIWGAVIIIVGLVFAYLGF